MDQDTHNVVVEVRPCVDARGNRTSWDICYPPEPDATGVGVIASCYGSLEQAQAMADALSHPTPTPSEDMRELLREAREYIAIDYGCGVVRGVETAKALLDRIDAALRSGSEGEAWQPIETAPRDGTEIDLWFPASSINQGQREANVRWNKFDGFWVRRDRSSCIYAPRPTHWMPLPDAPASTSKGTPHDKG